MQLFHSNISRHYNFTKTFSPLIQFFTKSFPPKMVIPKCLSLLRLHNTLMKLNPTPYYSLFSPAAFTINHYTILFSFFRSIFFVFSSSGNNIYCNNTCNYLFLRLELNGSILLPINRFLNHQVRRRFLCYWIFLGEFLYNL